MRRVANWVLIVVFQFIICVPVVQAQWICNGDPGMGTGYEDCMDKRRAYYACIGGPVNPSYIAAECTGHHCIDFHTDCAYDCPECPSGLGGAGPVLMDECAWIEESDGSRAGICRNLPADACSTDDECEQRVEELCDANGHGGRGVTPVHRSTDPVTGQRQCVGDCELHGAQAIVICAAEDPELFAQLKAAGVTIVEQEVYATWGGTLYRLNGLSDGCDPVGINCTITDDPEPVGICWLRNNSSDSGEAHVLFVGGFACTLWE